MPPTSFPAHRLRRGITSIALPLLATAGCGGEPGSGTSPVVGVRGDTITVGALVPLSDAVALIGKPVLAGQEAYFKQLNAEKGGVAGRYKVRVLAEDVTYANPSTSVQKYNRIKDQVALFSTILGTDHVNVTLPLLAEDNLLAIPTTMDAEWVREPHLISVLAPYQMQVINGLAYWVAEGGGAGRTVCTLAMSTGYGEAAEEGAAFAGKELGFTVSTTARFRPGDQDFVAPITQLKNGRCEGVVLASLPSETARILGTAAQLGFAPRWIATSPSWHLVLAQSPIAPYATKTLWVAFEGGEWGDTTSAGMRDLLRALAAYAPDQKEDTYLLAGFVFARAVHAVLEAAVAADDLSRAGIARAMTSLGTVENGGLSGDYRYGPIESREPPRAISIFAIDPAKPGSFSLVRRDYESEAARKFEFTRR